VSVSNEVQNKEEKFVNTQRFVSQNKGNARLWVIGIVALIVIIVLWNGFVTVPEGHIGLVLRFSAVKGQLAPGLHLLIPFVDKVETMNIREQKYEFKAETFSKQQQNVYIDLAVIYSLNKDSIEETYKTIGTLEDVEAKIVRPMANQIIKSIIPEYDTIKVHTNRQEIRDKTVKKLNEAMNRGSITADGADVPTVGVVFHEVNLVNIEFSDEYTNAIEEKQVAEQKVGKAQLEKLEAEERKQIAKINAEAKKIEQELVNASLTPAIIQSRWIEKWNGVLPSVMSGDSSGLILDMSNLGNNP